ncbi:hypothetical protein [Winogradskyella luteola]|uniref:DUF4177 domain-containing protein n=1 Tax=Winogradskyella luteola TaxID=2828330 RepID=A0A9X1F6Q5_9FLAO|nr:hypothetical protein [Winogradskyella luteola]MBV7268392.1 hypothetical protein [Winogradskyella luteola]
MSKQQIEYLIQNKFSHELSEAFIAQYLSEMAEDEWELISVEVRYAIDNPTEVNRRKFYFKRKL